MEQYTNQGSILTIEPTGKGQNKVQIDAIDLPWDGTLDLYLHNEYDANCLQAARSAFDAGSPVTVTYRNKVLKSGKKIKDTLSIVPLGQQPSDMPTATPAPATYTNSIPSSGAPGSNGSSGSGESDTVGRRISQQAAAKVAAMLLSAAVRQGTVAPSGDPLVGLADAHNDLTEHIHARYERRLAAS